ncbi:hypothetical protein RN001_007639 [Aquatica leii]|uniref:C2H2-type domain-containing protein n=1 Tax=Aquatica leii TaxID=1421715 RepID=A0AAN7SNY9_9COLE|nr:hypothetical protein RN001_007639 [Aquatica leii]
MAEILEEKQVTSKLAVFEHIPCKEKKTNAKDTGYKRSFKRCQSPPSDNDLVIDDEDSIQPPRKRNRGVRLAVEPLELQCHWENCQEVTNDYQWYIKHLKDHLADVSNNQHVFTCLWLNCIYTTSEKYILVQHVSYHGYHTKLKNIGKNVLERYNLPKCNNFSEVVFPVSLAGYSCDWEDCGSILTDIVEFHEHIKLHVNSNPKYCKDDEVIPCLWIGCNYKFPSMYKLSDHLRTHTKEKVVACPSCGSMFATKTKFYDHRKRQLPIEAQSYQCSQCSKLFPTERLLRDHMRSHINHYKCTLCDMTCPKPSALATHIRYRHLEERPLKCNICKLKCISKQCLEAHLITHCPEKLIACEECDFRCRSLYTLDKHYQNVHGLGVAQIYECHCCQARFDRGNLLTKHLIKAHDYYWPSGHSRFRYKEDTDGIYRLQTVRYESIEVTQEMITNNSTQQQPDLGGNSQKYNLRRRNDKTPNYVLMVAENGEQNVVCPTTNSIVITINDVDDKGNILNTETLQSNEMKIMESRNNSEKKDPV